MYRERVMPCRLHRSYGAHHLHFIICTLSLLLLSPLPLLYTARRRDRFLIRAGRRFPFGSCHVIEPLVQRFALPALRKPREGRGTRFVGDANAIKGRATRQVTPYFMSVLPTVHTVFRFLGKSASLEYSCGKVANCDAGRATSALFRSKTTT